MNRSPNTPSDNISPPALPPAPSVQPRLKGVRGWLLFFCLGLTVLNPLITLGLLAASYSESSKYFNRFPSLLAITVIETLLGVAMAAFSIYAGVGLWSVRPRAVQMAKRYLLCFLGYHAIAAVLPFMPGLPSAANEAMIAQVLQSITRVLLYFAIWNSYLNKSERVKATYES